MFFKKTHHTHLVEERNKGAIKICKLKCHLIIIHKAQTSS